MGNYSRFCVKSILIASTIYLLKAIAIAVSRDFWAIASKIYFLWVC
ncbi:hypothetical protein APA_3444 [Pseudanabaena sp. lw0831]|nr:hypothetical protein APA_3444 [Pseudanabaena sp. lw0831]